MKMDTHNTRRATKQHRKELRETFQRPRLAGRRETSSRNKEIFSDKERKQWGFGARAGKKVGYYEGVNGRHFRQVSKKALGSHAAGYRATYSEAYMAGKAHRNAGRAARELL